MKTVLFKPTTHKSCFVAYQHKFICFVENGEKKKQLFWTKWIVRKNPKYKNGVNKLKKNSMTGTRDEMNS